MPSKIDLIFGLSFIVFITFLSLVLPLMFKVSLVGTFFLMISMVFGILWGTGVETRVNNLSVAYNRIKEDKNCRCKNCPRN
jgi:hypothetical protein